MKLKVNHILVITFLIASLLLFVTAVKAETFEVSGNSPGSNNSINISSNSNTNSQQNNSVNVTNNVNSSADTGGNSASGNNGNVTIKTGNSTVNTTVNNEFNTNNSTVKCCTPTPKSPTSIPPTATPGPSGGGGQGGPPGDGGSSPTNSGGGGSSGSSSGGSQVLGLSATSGPEDEVYLFYIGGLLCLGLSAVLYRGGNQRS